MLHNFPLRKTEKVPITGQCRSVSLVTFAVHCLQLTFLLCNLIGPSVLRCSVVINMATLWPMWKDSKGFFQQYEPIFCSVL